MVLVAPSLGVVVVLLIVRGFGAVGVLVLLLAIGSLSPLLAQAPKSTLPAKRYGIELDLDKFPQATPKDTLTSILKAIELRKVDYLLA